jgi:Zn-dependent protease with chaperone function
MVTPGSPTFTAPIRHELAHLAHRDVTPSWLGRTLGWVLFPLLALPTITAARRLLSSSQLRKARLEQMFDNMEW